MDVFSSILISMMSNIIDDIAPTIVTLVRTLMVNEPSADSEKSMQIEELKIASAEDNSKRK